MELNEELKMTKTFENLDGIIRFLENAPEGTYVRDYADDAGFQSAKEALDSYKEIRDNANADEIAAFEDTELEIIDTSATARQVEEEGCADLDGYRIYTADAIASEQKCWDDSDKAKHMDFSGSVYWVTTGDENGPLGFDSVEDAVRSVIER